MVKVIAAMGALNAAVDAGGRADGDESPPSLGRDSPVMQPRKLATPLSQIWTGGSLAPEEDPEPMLQGAEEELARPSRACAGSPREIGERHLDLRDAAATGRWAPRVLELDAAGGGAQVVGMVARVPPDP